MRRFVLLLPLVLAACGGAPHARARPFTVASYGHGPMRVWLFRPQGRPRAAVVFIHGHGDIRETTPYYHRPWLEHLAREGVAVAYPRYELYPGQPGALKRIVLSLRVASHHLPRRVPVVAIGYSRGGRLVADWASVATASGLVPSTILSVFPSGLMDRLLNLGSIRPHTEIVILAGDHDSVVGTVGAGELANQLAASGISRDDVHFEVVRSNGAFEATHLSVLESSPGARAAFWVRADRLIDAVAAGA